jgi:hypothetical protein
MSEYRYCYSSEVGAGVGADTPINLTAAHVLASEYALPPSLYSLTLLGCHYLYVMNLMIMNVIAWARHVRMHVQIMIFIVMNDI